MIIFRTRRCLPIPATQLIWSNALTNALTTVMRITHFRLFAYSWPTPQYHHMLQPYDVARSDHVSSFPWDSEVLLSRHLATTFPLSSPFPRELLKHPLYSSSNNRRRFLTKLQLTDDSTLGANYVQDPRCCDDPDSFVNAP